jgi:hypothetical protein
MLLADMTRLRRSSEPLHQGSINDSKSAFGSRRPKARRGNGLGHDDGPSFEQAVTPRQGALLHLHRDFVEIKMSGPEKILVTVVNVNRVSIPNNESVLAGLGPCRS